jgi:hypothetical protein
MFKIVLQPEEQALHKAVREGLCAAGTIPVPVVLKFIALRMMVCDERGCPKLTDLGEAALARMQAKLH